MIRPYRLLPPAAGKLIAEMAQSTLDAALRGDDEAFRALVEPHRDGLHAHCYRMLGSLQDAEDALQETLLRCWRGLARFDRARPLRPWLYRIATNVCMNALARRSRRVLSLDVPSSEPGAGAGEPLAESLWLEPYPLAPEASYEERESVELAFVAALQHLAPAQRAVLILRDVLGFSAREVSEQLDATTAAVNSSLQRARRTLAASLPDRTQQGTLRALGDARMRELVERYVAAWERRDVDALVAILAEDVTFAMPPHPHWWRGRDDVIGAVVRSGLPDVRKLRTEANGQPAVAWYVRETPGGPYAARSIEVLSFDGERVSAIVAFVSTRLFACFGLPSELK
jgi:RNA polymerase sigma-70 factor, ECF subfamily